MATPKKTAVNALSGAYVTYRDRLYASRPLFLPDGRALSVVKQQVSVEVSDTLALSYLEQHPDFSLKE
ncbi:hypothetical protein DM813_25945 [Pseudomonas alkylphenolica]|uniref:Uncharacterized protein n=1 Tax=Pseudomonas alkylphenolica TaxID=237609 RepID=A0A443ZGU0_9PSED|nr:hypothetical protein [Pseudomonas alkylphenolica]RWU18108.1 hypothetical protein DM813_25945 [Pseudomonas alkylphenolica]